MSQAQLNPADEGAQLQNSAGKDRGGRDSVRWVAGVALIVIGILALIAENTNSHLFGLLFLPALGATFLAWGAATHKIGLLVPGGVIGGVGLGAFLVQEFHLEGQMAGGTVLLSMALGWVLITVLAEVFGDRRCTWPLIPAAILGVIGWLLLAGIDSQSVRAVANVWPVVLIALGLYLLYVRTRK